jgi:hypothetical protein
MSYTAIFTWAGITIAAFEVWITHRGVSLFCEESDWKSTHCLVFEYEPIWFTFDTVFLLTLAVFSYFTPYSRMLKSMCFRELKGDINSFSRRKILKWAGKPAESQSIIPATLFFFLLVSNIYLLLLNWWGIRAA